MVEIVVVVINIMVIFSIILLRCFILFMFVIVEVILKKIRGMIIMNIKLRNKLLKGFMIVILGLIVYFVILLIKIVRSRISDDLYVLNIFKIIVRFFLNNNSFFIM